MGDGFGKMCYLCIEKAEMGCGSAMKRKRVFICIAFALHYLCNVKAERDGGLAMKERQGLVAVRLSCTIFRTINDIKTEY